MSLFLTCLYSAECIVCFGESVVDFMLIMAFGDMLHLKKVDCLTASSSLLQMVE